jgi:hypothetical protein
VKSVQYFSDRRATGYFRQTLQKDPCVDLSGDPGSIGMRDFDLGAAIVWLRSQGPRHFGAKSARQYWTAIQRFDAERLPNEPGTAMWFLEHLDADLVPRFSRRSSVGESSVRTYASRARAGIGLYAEWLSDPAGWRPRRRVSSSEPRAETPVAGLERPTRLPQSLEEEVQEALQALGRWPRLRPFLIDGISDAIKRTNGEQK